MVTKKGDSEKDGGGEGAGVEGRKSEGNSDGGSAKHLMK